MYLVHVHLSHEFCFKIKLDCIFFAIDYQSLVLYVYKSHWILVQWTPHFYCVLFLQSCCQFWSTWLISKQFYFLLSIWITLILGIANMMSLISLFNSFVNLIKDIVFNYHGYYHWCYLYVSDQVWMHLSIYKLVIFASTRFFPSASFITVSYRSWLWVNTLSKMATFTVISLNIV